jgi:hypothetical protein
MAPETLHPSLFDCVNWAYARPGLKNYSFEQLARVYLERTPEECYVVVDATGFIRGTAAVRDIGGGTVHIAHIATDGSTDAISGFVSKLQNDFPLATLISFWRRGQIREFPIEKLGRMLRLKKFNL